MSDYGRLAFTGLSTVSIFGVVVDQWWLAALAVLIIVLGVVALRVGFRRDRAVGER